MAADLRTVLVRLTRMRCTWTAEEVASLADMPLKAARAYCQTLVTQQVLIVVEGKYATGPQAIPWRSKRPANKGPQTYGNSAKYRETRALWDKITARDWELARKGRGKRRGAPAPNTPDSLTSQLSATDDTNVHQHAGDSKMASPSLTGGSMTCDEAASELNVSVDTIRREIKRGRLKAHRVGLYNVRITRTAIDEYRTQNAITPDKQA